MAFNLEDYIKADSIGKRPEELQDMDFRLDDYHACGGKIGIYRRETWGKMFRDPLYRTGLIQGFNDLGFRFYMMKVRDWTVGRPAIQNKKGEIYIRAMRPIAKMVHFIWHSMVDEEVLPEYKDEYNIFNSKEEEE